MAAARPWRCSRCGQRHGRRRFSGGIVRGQSYCYGCHAAYMRATRPRHSELTPEQRAKANARAQANVAQGRGKLRPGPCETCGEKDAEKHHPDYQRPLEVVWLCRACHLELHAAA